MKKLIFLFVFFCIAQTVIFARVHRSLDANMELYSPNSNSNYLPFFYGLSLAYEDNYISRYHPFLKNFYLRGQLTYLRATDPVQESAISRYSPSVDLLYRISVLQNFELYPYLGLGYEIYSAKRLFFFPSIESGLRVEYLFNRHVFLRGRLGWSYIFDSGLPYSEYRFSLGAGYRIGRKPLLRKTARVKSKKIIEKYLVSISSFEIASEVLYKREIRLSQQVEKNVEIGSIISIEKQAFQIKIHPVVNLIGEEQSSLQEASTDIILADLSDANILNVMLAVKKIIQTENDSQLSDIWASSRRLLNDELKKETTIMIVPVIQKKNKKILFSCSVFYTHKDKALWTFKTKVANDDMAFMGAGKLVSALLPFLKKIEFKNIKAVRQSK